MFIKNFTSCGCIPTVVSNPPTTVDPCGDCLRVPGLVLNCVDSVGPCGNSGQIDLSTFHNGDTFCDSGVTYGLLSWDEFAFTSISLDVNSGLLTFTTSDSATPNTYPLVTYQVTCIGQIEASQGSINICIQDQCTNIVCPQGEVCDKCDGTCKPINDIEVS